MLSSFDQLHALRQSLARMAWEVNLFHATALLAVSWIMRTYCSTLTGPNNIVAKLGDNVEFECSTSATTPIPLEWAFTSATSSHEKQVLYYSGEITHNLTSKYAIKNTTPGGYNLIMDSVDHSFSGTYTCSESEEQHHAFASAELIVIASDPVCGTNASTTIKEGDYIQMWCTMYYSGRNFVPEMKWTKSNGQSVGANITCFGTPTILTSAFTTQLNLSDEGVTFTCNTNFPPMSTNISMAQTAVNTPQYQHLWNYYTAFLSLASSTSHTPRPDSGLVSIIGIIVGAVILLMTIILIFCKLRKKGQAKPDVVSQLEPNTLDDSDRPQAPHNPPLYAEVQRIPNGFHVFTSVKKKRTAGDIKEHLPTVTNNHQQCQSIPVYEEVNKMVKEEIIPGPPCQTPPSTNTKSKQTYVGADGTQYMELDSLTELKSNGVPERHPPMFCLVETYASIDHSTRAPPPPPQLPRRHRN